MTGKPKAKNRVDELLDELIAEDYNPEAVLGNRSPALKKLVQSPARLLQQTYLLLLIPRPAITLIP